MLSVELLIIASAALLLVALVCGAVYDHTRAGDVVDRILSGNPSPSRDLGELAETIDRPFPDRESA